MNANRMGGFKVAYWLKFKLVLLFTFKCVLQNSFFVLRSFFDLLGNGCLHCASFSSKFKGFFLSNSFIVRGHNRSPVTISHGNSLPEFKAMISFRLSLEQWLSWN